MLVLLDCDALQTRLARAVVLKVQLRTLAALLEGRSKYGVCKYERDQDQDVAAFVVHASSFPSTRLRESAHPSG